MSLGPYISGLGHAGFIAWLVIGWGLDSDPLDFEVTEVAVISGADFARMTQGIQPDQPLTDTPALDAPVVEDVTPIPVVDAPPDPIEQPAPVLAPPADVAPDVPETTPPPPVTSEIADAPPETPVTPEVPVFVPPAPDLQSSPRPVARPADVIAPDPVAPPPPEVTIAEDTTAPTAPSDAAAEVVVDEQDATAQQETAPELVTEADEPASSAPTQSLRPRLPERRPTAPVASNVSDDPADDVANAIAAAVAEANSGGSTDRQGPPLTGAEQEGLRVAVNECWVRDPGSEADRILVTVEFSLTREGRVDGDVRLASASDGSDAVVNAAFQKARRAVIRCQNRNGQSGYDLPAEKYDHWRDVRIIFGTGS